MSDDHNDSARRGICGNSLPEAIDDSSAQDHGNPPAPVTTRRRDSPEPHVQSSPLLRIPAAQAYLGGISKTKMYELITQGELEVVRLGGITLITVNSAAGLIARNTGRSGDRAAIESAKTAARESVRVRKEKKRLVPGKLRTRAARGAAGASNEGGADTRGNAIRHQARRS